MIAIPPQFGCKLLHLPKFWLKVMNELKARGVADFLIAVVDGLTGFPDAIGAVFPQTTVQTPDRVGGRLCIVHLIRNSLAFVSWKDQRTALGHRKSTTSWDAIQPDCREGGSS